MPPKKAKCIENQIGLDRLWTKYESVANASSSQYVKTLSRAITSLAAHPTAILSYDDALALKYVGAHCANIICPPNKQTIEQRKKSKKTTKTGAAAKKKKPPPSTSCSVTSTPTDSVLTNRSNNETNEASLHGAGVIAENIGGGTGLPTIIETTAAATAPVQQQQISNKERIYRKQLQESINWNTRILANANNSQQEYTWRVVLLVDGREVQSEHVLAKLQMSGIPCEERHLPIGDMAWIIQGLSSSSNKVEVELMVGTIMERKTPEDLKSSIFGTRYFEQRLRLQNSGLSQLLYLVEGDTKNSNLYKCSSDTLHTAMWETRLYLNFSIVQTQNLDQTVLTLKRYHRRILQRTFPCSLSGILPEFGEVHRTTTNTSTTPSSNNQQRNNRRRKRRLQSLTEMTFDTCPELPLGMDRFITYAELKAKIERDRQIGTKTISHIHNAMLKQVSTISDKKCHAIAEQFPTTSHLFRAVNGDNFDFASIDMNTDPNKPSARASKVGPKSANAIQIAYGTIDPDHMNNVSIDIDNGNAKNILGSPAAARALDYDHDNDHDEYARRRQQQQQATLPTSTTLSPAKRSLAFDAAEKRRLKLSTTTTTTTLMGDNDDDNDNDDDQKKPKAKKTKRKLLNTSSLGSLGVDSSDNDDDVYYACLGGGGSSQKATNNSQKKEQEVIEID